MNNLLMPGQLVRVKSGGPLMTIVTMTKGNGGYKCQWFDGKKLEVGFFPSNSLKLVDQPNDSQTA
ncbi:hypothetical protein A9993_03930 [Rahnella victoriana]|uniref:YodC family protein n=1 Tax=Rahnella victoriana TaxID=1510570 RepID=UPI000BB1E652|nr:DUF2158 domain-containing protein [Rahnella victoriana]PBI78922.1 hypothetical protein A9993_03930 [Rahnella victoriana]